MHLWDGEPEVEQGALVVVAGAPAAEALEASARCGAAAVLHRRPEESGRAAQLSALAEGLGVPVLWLRSGHPWLDVVARLRALLSGTGAPAGEVAGDLFALADEIAAAVGGPVIIEDPSFRVLAYSAFVGEMDRGRAEAILGRRTPDPWLEHLTRTGSLEQLRTTDDVVDLRDGPWQARRRLLTAVRAGTRTLGVVWVAEGAVPLPGGAVPALRQAVDRATPVFLRHRERADAEADRRSRLVRVLLEGQAAALPAAAEFGMGATGTFVVIAAAPAEPAVDRGPHPAAAPVGSLGTDDVWGRLADHVTLCCESFRRPAVATRFGNHVLAVVEVAPRTGDDALRRLPDEVVRLAGSGRLAPLHAAVSSVGTGVGSLGRLRDEAVAALGALASRSDSASTRFQDVEAEVLVRGVVARLDPGASLTALDRLVAHDRAHRSELVSTLRAYLDACGVAAATADRLGVHVTTVRHRLGRIETVSGARLDRPEVRLALDLLLRRGAVA